MKLLIYIYISDVFARAHTIQLNGGVFLYATEIARRNIKERKGCTTVAHIKRQGVVDRVWSVDGRADAAPMSSIENETALQNCSPSVVLARFSFKFRPPQDFVS